MKHDWTLEEIREIHDSPLMELVLRASDVHRKYHKAGEVQCSQLINVKFGGCEEDCSYCAQAARYHTGVTAQPFLTVDEVRKQAEACKAQGVTRICLSVAWRQVRNGKAFDQILEMVKVVKELGLEPCCTLGMLQEEHVARLKDAGIYAINHNLDSSSNFYDKIISTRTYSDRLDTLKRVMDAKVSVCCGGIIGLGEELEDRLMLLQTLSSFDPHPGSVPINLLSRVKGTPLEEGPKVTGWELLRMVATARILMPKSMVRLSSGRLELSVAQQALCFLAGANSVHVGDRLLATPNPEHHVDWDMFRMLGLTKQAAYQRVENTKLQAVPVEIMMKEALTKRANEGILRKLTLAENCVDLASNDYLGFAQSTDLLERIAQEEGRVGATGSRLLTGNTAYAIQLEEQIASSQQAEAALLYNSGYTANLGLLSCIMGKEDTVILDTQSHASTWDGAKTSGARLLVFRHNDLESLETQLKKAQGRIFVCVESLYSMSGDIAPLDSLCDLCERYSANLIVDEAHATGLFGMGGRGIVNAHRLEKRVFARVHTFSKALGAHGAVVLGSAALKEYLLNFSRPLIYATALPPHALVTIRCAYERMLTSDDARHRLHRLIVTFKERAQQSELSIRVTDTPIQTIQVGGQQARELSAVLAQAKIDVRAILPPTVRKGEECLRVCLHAFNTQLDIDLLFDALENVRIERDCI